MTPPPAPPHKGRGAAEKNIIILEKNDIPIPPSPCGEGPGER